MARSFDRRTVLRGLMALAGASRMAPAGAASAPAAFDAAMRGWIGRHRVKNASLAVMRGDRLVLAQGYGERGAHERVSLWSLSKAITAACVAALVREGRLSLDDRLGTLLKPLFDLHGAPADARFARATVAQLLAHRGGWPGTRQFAPGFVEMLQRVAPEEAHAGLLMPAVLKQPLAREPGERFEYTNTGYLLLGQVIEACAGEPYAEACRRWVLAPAGIAHVTPDPVWGRMLQAAGGWAMSAPEYLAFLRLLRPRQPDFLTPALRTWMTDGKAQAHEAFGPGLAYTLGMHLRRASGDLFHAGAWSWRRTGPDGPVAVRHGTWAELTADGTAWVATFDTLSPAHDREPMDELIAALWRAKRETADWPSADLFDAAGVGPLAIEARR